MTSRELNQSALLLLLLGFMLMAGYECEEADKKDCPKGTVEMNKKCYWRTKKRTTAEKFDCEEGKLAILNDRKDDLSKLAPLLTVKNEPEVLRVGLIRTGDSERKYNWYWEGSTIRQNWNKNWAPNSNNAFEVNNCGYMKFSERLKKVVFIAKPCTKRFYNLCCADPKLGHIADKDPHFLLTSSVERNTHLCFDVDGEDGDVLTLVQDPDRKLQVNGQLFESHSTTIHTALFSAMAVMCGEDNIIATKDNITVNEAHTVQWDDTYDVELYNRGSVSSIDNSTVGIKLTSDIQIEVTRSKNRKGDTYLGIHITHGDGVGDHAKGIIGKFIRGKFSAISPIDKHYPWMIEFPELAISVPVHQRTRYVSVLQRSVQCWFYKVNTDASRDDLLGRRTDYTVDDLTYTPF